MIRINVIKFKKKLKCNNVNMVNIFYFGLFINFFFLIIKEFYFLYSFRIKLI